MHAVESRQHEERRAVDTARKFQVQVLIGLDVFDRLHVHKDEAKDECQREKCAKDGTLA